MKALKVFEIQNFERGIDPKDSMSIGDVQGRLLKKRRVEATQCMEEILDTYGGDGPHFYNKGDDATGFKIGIYQDGPINSPHKINDVEARYYIEFSLGREVFFAGWEQENEKGHWIDRQWESSIAGKPIENIWEAKQVLINYIVTNQTFKTTK